MDTLKSYGLIQTAIDMVGYYGGNMVVSRFAGVSQKPKLEDTVIFGISDIIVRNGAISIYSGNTMFSGNLGKNAYIGVISFILNTGLDMLRGDSIGVVVKENLIKNALGVGTNTAIDMFVPNSYK